MSLSTMNDPDKAGQHPAKDDPRERGKYRVKGMIARIGKEIPGIRPPSGAKGRRRLPAGETRQWRLALDKRQPPPRTRCRLRRGFGHRRTDLRAHRKPLNERAVVHQIGQCAKRKTPANDVRLK